MGACSSGLFLWDPCPALELTSVLFRGTCVLGAEGGGRGLGMHVGLSLTWGDLAPAAAQPAERLERTLQEVAERWQQERRERRRLHDALVVGVAGLRTVLAVGQRGGRAAQDAELGPLIRGRCLGYVGAL